MKSFLSLLLLCPFGFAYDVGDTVSPEIAARLGIENDSRIYVVDFFASWCGSCRKELPLIAELRRRSDPGEVVIVGVDTDKNVEKGRAFRQMLKTRGHLNFPAVEDPDSQIIGTFDPVGMPAVYLIKNGKVAATLFGATDDIDRVIEARIKEL